MLLFKRFLFESFVKYLSEKVLLYNFLYRIFELIVLNLDVCLGYLCLFVLLNKLKGKLGNVGIVGILVFIGSLFIGFKDIVLIIIVFFLEFNLLRFLFLFLFKKLLVLVNNDCKELM